MSHHFFVVRGRGGLPFLERLEVLSVGTFNSMMVTLAKRISPSKDILSTLSPERSSPASECCTSSESSLQKIYAIYTTADLNKLFYYSSLCSFLLTSGYCVLRNCVLVTLTGYFQLSLCVLASLLGLSSDGPLLNLHQIS